MLKQAVKQWEAQGKPGRKPTKPRKPKELPLLTEEELAWLPKLPDGWADSHLHEFTIWKKRYPEYPESKEDGLERGRYRLGELIKQ